MKMDNISLRWFFTSAKERSRRLLKKGRRTRARKTKREKLATR